MAQELSMDCTDETPAGVPTTPGGSVSPVEEYKRVEALTSAPLKAGSSYFLVNRRWYTEWLQWVGHPIVQSPHQRPSADPLLPTSDSLPLDGNGPDVGSPQNSAKRTRTRSWTKDRPGQIDNTELLEEGSTSAIKRTIFESSDYEIVPEDAWALLYGWYGGGPPIKRRAISLPSGGVQVELHGLQLKVYKSSDTAGVPLEVIESKCTTIKDVKANICREMGLEDSKVRLWDYFNNRPYALLEKSLDKTLEACRIFDKNPLLLEEQAEDGSWPHQDQADGNDTVGPSTSVGGYTSTFSAGSADVASTGEPIQKGAVGLQNLGNTCFMNSSLQCLSNIPPLRTYFLSDEYKETLNRSAFKTEGKLAEAFAELLTVMWRDNTTRVAPRNFKWQVGQFAEQFSGYGQQDSMELIEYVLDGLKEDLNTVTGQKPYVELKEADGRPDSEIAAEALEAYRKRSNSRVDDLFVGLFKSVVRCPEPSCGRVSLTFDPFLSAKVSLSSSVEQRQTSFSLTMIRNSVPTGNSKFVEQVKVQVNKDASVKQLVEAAAKEVGEGLVASRCVLVEVWNKKVHKFFEDSESVESIRSEDQLLLFEVDDAKAFTVSTEQRWGSSFSFGSSGPLAACSGETSVGDASPSSSSSCGVILHQRQVPSGRMSSSWGYSSRDLTPSLPLLLSIPKDASPRTLYKEVERRIEEFVIEPGSGEPPAWKIYKITRDSITSEGEIVDGNSDKPLDLKDSREYFAVEWEEGANVPFRYTQDSLRAGSATNGIVKDGEVHLSQLLQMFVEDEQLGPDDAWYCNRCKEHKEAWKKLEFHHCPPTLVLQLKRFQYTRWSRERLNTPVRFPIENLDVSPYRTASSLAAAEPEPSVYDLAGMSKHIGSLGGGHYVAYCRSSIDGEWYYFDDGSVSRCSVQEVEEDRVGAYVLFYIRRDHRPSSWGPPPSPSP